MSDHKENCQWDDFEFSVAINDPEGPDYQLSLTEDGFGYNSVYKPTDADMYISFSFCPCCGVEL